MIRSLLAIWACCCCAAAFAQPAPADAPTEPAAPTTAPAARSFLPREDQERLVPASDFGTSLDPAANPQAAPLPAYIAQLQLDGSVVGDSADMTANIRIEITRDGWFEVPLALDQAHIYEWHHTGAGEAAPAVPRNGDEGVHWQLRGQGTHRLQIRFHLPVRTSVGGRQLQLSLPQLPARFVAQAVLRVPDPRAVPRDPPLNVTVRRQVLESGETEFACEVSGSRWELSWRTQADDVPRIKEVVTAIRLRRESGRLRLAARQQCAVEQGSLSEITVRAPPGFELQSVQLISGASGPLTSQSVPDRPGWWRVHLDPPVQGSVELDWAFTRTFPAGGGPVVVEGLDVDGAREQRGRIEIEALEGYAARWQPDDSRALQRVEALERRAGEPLVEYRFEFRTQPFRLEYQLAPIAATTEAESEAFVWVEDSEDGQRTDLFLGVRLEVLSGHLFEIVLDWPGREAAGWTPRFSRTEVAVEAGEAAVEIVGATLDQDAFRVSPEQLRLQLARPCSGVLRALLRFTRQAAPGQSRLDLQLPRPVAKFHRGSLLSVAGAINLETTVSASEGELRRVPRNGPLPAGLPPEVAASPLQTYSLPVEPPVVHVGWTEHPRTIVAETSLVVESVSATAVRVVQEIAYNVSHGYVPTLLLDVPPSLRDALTPALLRAGAADDVGVSVRLEDEVVVPELREGHLWISLPQPRHGRFRLAIEHVVPLPAPSASPATFAIPIVQSADADFTATQLRIVGTDTLRLADDESGWQSWLTRTGGSAWLTSEQRSSVTLVVDDSLRNVPQQFTVTTAFIRTWFGDPGQVSIHAEYEIREAPPRVLVTLPQAAASAEFGWNGRPLSGGRDARNAAPSSGQYLLDLAARDTPAVSGRLSIKYRLQQPQPLGLWSWRSVAFPEFGDKVFVDETFWEVVLPPGQQLFAPPAGMVPQYTWERQVAVWARRPTAEYRVRREQMAAPDSHPAAAAHRAGNAYAYSTIGPLARGEFGAMAQSFIVLIGAGITLLLGFVFGRIPATRNALSLLVLAFLFALASLWQLELMQLLLQPAVFGLVLAAVATAFDTAARRGRRGRRRETTLEPLAPISERRSSVQQGAPAAPARTALYHPEPVSESGRGS